MLYLEEQDSKIQSMLAWCSIGVVCSYFILVLNIVRFYSTLESAHPLWLIIILTLAIFLFAFFVYIQWMLLIYKPLESRMVIKAFLQFKVDVTSRHVKLLSGYMITYFLIALSFCLLCWYDAAYSLKKVLEITTPTGIVVYSAGLFLLVKLVYTRKTFINYLHLIYKLNKQ